MKIEIQDVGEKSRDDLKIMTWDAVKFLGLDPDENYSNVIIEIIVGDVIRVRVDKYLPPEEISKKAKELGEYKITYADMITTEEYYLVDGLGDDENKNTIKLQVKKIPHCCGITGADVSNFINTLSKEDPTKIHNDENDDNKSND